MKTADALIVEGNRSHAEMAKAALVDVERSCRAVVARDGDEAIRMLIGAEHLQLRLVILSASDASPGWRRLLLWLKTAARTRRIPVVVLSSSRRFVPPGEAYDLGANGYVLKPHLATALRSTLEGLWAWWMVRNVPPAWS